MTKRINPDTGVEEEVIDTPPGDTPQGDGSPQDIELKNQIERLDSIQRGQGKPPLTELDKAQFTLESVKARIRKLGGNPDTQPEKPAASGVSQKDLDAHKAEMDAKLIRKDAEAEAKRRVGSVEEFSKVMDVYDRYPKSGNVIEDIENATLIANKTKNKQTEEEKRRAAGAQHHQASPFGQKPPSEASIPELSPLAARAIKAANMAWDPAMKAFVGKKVRLREVSKGNFVSELRSRDKRNGQEVWREIPNAGDFDNIQ